MGEIMAPNSWDEFRREYQAGRCWISFDPARTRLWTYNQGWIRTMKPHVIWYSLVATIVASAGIWLTELLITIPNRTFWMILLVAVFGGAVFGWFQSARKCFAARIMASEDAFWLAYRESGVDFYRINPALPPILRWLR